MFIIFDNKKVKKILLKLFSIYNKILYKIKLNCFLKWKINSYKICLKKENKNLIISKSENIFNKKFFINENHIKNKINNNKNTFLNYNKSFNYKNNNNIKRLFLNIDSNTNKKTLNKNFHSNSSETKKFFNNKNFHSNYNSFSSIFNTNSNNKKNNIFNEFPITKSLKNIHQIKKNNKKKENEIFDYLQLFFINQIKNKKTKKNKFLNNNSNKKKKNIFNIRNYSNFLKQEKNLDNFFSNLNKNNENKIKVQQIINKYKNIDDFNNYLTENNKNNNNKNQIKIPNIQKINVFSDSSKSTQLISKRSNNEDEIKKIKNKNLMISNEINEEFNKNNNNENKITIQSFSDSKIFDYADKFLQKNESFLSY